MVLKSKEVDLILPRLIYFLQGKWCVAVTEETDDEERAAADAEMKSWFAAAEQVWFVGVFICGIDRANGLTNEKTWRQSCSGITKHQCLPIKGYGFYR